MAKIVFLTSRFPYPLDKGDKLRVFHQLRSLAERDEVHLISLSRWQPEPEHLQAVKQICTSVHNFVLPLPQRLLAVALSPFRQIPLQVAYFYNRRIARSIRQLIADIQPDHIHSHLIRTTEYVKDMGSIPRTLDYMDAFGLGIDKRQQIERNPLKNLLFRYEKAMLYKYETRAFTYADRHCIISRQDQKAIRTTANDSIEIVANGVDLDRFYPRPAEKRYDLVFMGNMAYPPNVVAVSFLVEKILPLVHAQRPETNVLIAGINPTKKVRSLASGRVDVIPHFDDISDSIAMSRIMVTPMQISIGLQNKIIQAMAMKVPCLASTSCNLALGAEPGRQILLADAPEEYCQAILALLSDPDQYREIAEAGYQFVIHQYSWPIQNEKLRALIHTSP